MLNKLKTFFAIFVLIISFIVLFLSIYCLMYYDNGRKVNTKTQKETKKKIIKTNKHIEIDFDDLQEKNNDAVAYIRVPGTKIDYVVLEGRDNDYYLDHDFDKKYNVAGWVFADYRTRFDESDKNIVIYGHNMKDGSMFGTLKNVLTESWQSKEDNRVITLVTQNREYKYEVFSTYTIDAESYYITTDFSNLSYIDFLNTLKNRSTYNYDIELNENDKILTLSSCSGSEKRIVLHAKLKEQ